MGQSKDKLIGEKPNGAATISKGNYRANNAGSLPVTTAEKVAVPSMRARLSDVLKDLKEVADTVPSKLDAPESTGEVGQVLQKGQDGKLDWVTPMAGSTPDSAMSDLSTNAIQNKVVKAYVDTVDGKVSDLGQEVREEMVETYGYDAHLAGEEVLAVIDKSGRVIASINKDGSIYPINGELDGINEELSEINDELDEKVPKEQGKVLIDENVADSFSSKLSPDYVYAIIDSAEHLIGGVKNDGTFVLPSLESDTIDKITSIASLIKKSEYIDEKNDTETLSIVDPSLAGDYEVITASNETEMDGAIARFNSGENIAIRLTNDIAITGKKTLSGTGKLLISGGGKKIYQSAATYNAAGVKNGMAYAAYQFGSIHRKFISDSGELLGFAHSKYYNAAGRITDENGGTFNGINDGTTAGTRRFKLPNELSNIVISEQDNVYVNFSCWFVSYTCKVLYTNNGYLYFDYPGGYNVDGDYYYAKKYTSFQLLNYSNNGIVWRSGNLFFPAGCSSLIDCGDFRGFEISAGQIIFQDIKFLGSSSSASFVGNIGGEVILSDCKFSGFGADFCVKNESINAGENFPAVSNGIGKLYVHRCVFSELFSGAVYSGVDTICKVDGSYFRDCGLGRSNYANIEAKGEYHISYNEFDDFGYCAIRVGVISMSEAHTCKGIVEQNILRQSLLYTQVAEHRTLMDGGAVYIATNNTKAVVRYNRIEHFNGRADNRGIYCDDGAYNFSVYSNIIGDTSNSYSIDARYATGRTLPSGENDNVNKVVAQNVVSSCYRVQGNPNILNNGCIVDVNIITNVSQENKEGNLEYSAEQIRTMAISISGGFANKFQALSIWGIN